MIKHYLILKLKKEYNNRELIEEIKNKFKKMECEIEFIYDMKFIDNCNNNRDSNSDLIITFFVNSLEDLNRYITHEQHLNFIKEYGGKIYTKVTIDEQMS